MIIWLTWCSDLKIKDRIHPVLFAPFFYLNAIVWYNRGVEFFNANQNQKAIECYIKALEINPWFTEAWNNVGFIFQKSGNYKIALLSYDKALNINPNFTIAQQNKLQIYNLIQTANNQKSSAYNTSYVGQEYDLWGRTSYKPASYQF